MTKTQTELNARTNADKNVTVQAVTVAQLEALDYTTKRDMAVGIAKNVVNLDDVDVKWTDAYVNAYADRVQAIWGSKVKQAENAKRNWRTAASGLSTTDAYKKIDGIVRSFNIRGLRENGSGYRSSIDVERAWGVGGTVYFSYERDGEPTVNPEDANQRAYPHSLKVEFSWSSTGRTLAEATASVNLYTELIEVAAEVESVMRRECVVSVYGLPEPVVAAEPVESN